MQTHCNLCVNFFFIFEQSATSRLTTSTHRLLKEILKIHQSPLFQRGDYTIDLNGDSFDSWNVQLRRAIDRDSNLQKDLNRLKRTEGIDCLTIHIKFSDKYPLDPPFAHIVSPVVKGVEFD